MAYIFLAKEYFVGEVLIPNLANTTLAGSSNIAELTSFCNLYEPKFLKRLLGEDLYDLYIAGINTGSPDAKWTALKNKIYVISGVTPTYISPAANYVYFFLRRHYLTISVSSGEQKPEYQNSVQAENFKLIKAWNLMVEMIEDFWEWIEEDAQVLSYPEFSYDDDGLSEFKIINPYL
jgi:hypothetical protein